MGRSPLDRPCVDLVDIEHGHGIRTLYGLQGKLESVTASPDSRLVAAVANDWRVGIWDLASGRLRAVIEVPVGYFVDNTAVAFDTEGRRFACSAGHQAWLWDLDKNQLLNQWELPEGLDEGLAFRGADQLLLISNGDQERQEPTIQPYQAQRRSARLPAVQPARSDAHEGL